MTREILSICRPRDTVIIDNVPFGTIARSEQGEIDRMPL